MNSMIYSIIVGSFTLIASLSGIWLKSHLDSKSTSKVTKKQNTVRIYSLLNQINSNFIDLFAATTGFKNAKRFNSNLFEQHNELNNDLVRQIELLILEHFFELKSKFIDIYKFILNEKKNFFEYLNPHNPNQQPFSALEKSFKNFQTELLNKSHELQMGLEKKYIQ